MLVLKLESYIGISQPPPQALRFSQGRGERLVISRKGPWEKYKRQAKPVVFFPTSFARARETSGYEAGYQLCCG